MPTLAGAQQLDDETLIARLTEVRGIGRWTVEMLLMFRLGRPDVLPVDDYGVRQGFAIAYRKRKLPPPKALAKYGARWAPYRTVASWYLWRAVDLRSAAPDRCHAASAFVKRQAGVSLKDPRILGITRIRTLGIATITCHAGRTRGGPATAELARHRGEAAGQ